MKKILNIMAIAAMMFLTVSCDNSDNFVIKIDHFYICNSNGGYIDNIKIVKGESIQLKTEVWPSSSPQRSFFWYSDDEAVATVSPNGVLTAVGTGTCFITAESTESKSVRKSLEVTVVESGIPIAENAVDQGQADARRR